MKFSESLWEQIAPIYQKIIQHPFNVELAQGTLDQERFIFYMEQDVYYLVNSSRALALIADRSDSPSINRHFTHFSSSALATAREIKENFSSSGYGFDRIEPSPACRAYVQYLLATAARSSFAEAMTAVLPCFLIYKEVGNNIAAQATEDNPYIYWISKYTSQEYLAETDLTISIFDGIASQCSTNQLARMEDVFEHCALFEWHFWDDAYNMITSNKTYTRICKKHS